MPTQSKSWPLLLQWAVIALIVVPTVAWLSFHRAPPVPSDVANLPVGLVLAVTIGGLAWNLFPVAARIAAGWRLGTTWALYISTMVFCASAGTAAVATIPFLVGVIDAGDIKTLFLMNISATVPMTIVIGMAMILIGSAKARIEATELSLKTQQLERERAEKLATEAQLASLTSRVQPHFLFNTLNSISGLIRERPVEAETMIEHLASLLRSSLDSKDVVPLAQELKLVTDYLEIQRTRLGARLRYDLAVAADASGNVPPFSLQTLVENALKHVAGRRSEGVVLQIAARRDGAALVLDVVDDGPGFDPDAMTAGHGLDILQRRLQAVFGATAAVEFIRRPQAMTVRLRISAA